MGSLLGDFRYAFRSLVRQPTFAAMAILTLVLGIGTNTAIFSVIKAVLLNKLPYQDPSRLVVLWEQNPDGNTDLVAPLTYLDWKEQATSIQSMMAFRQLRYAFAGDGQPLDVASVRATANLFSTLRVNAMVGRTFLPEESTPGQDRVAVLSRAFWERHFGGAQDAIGRTIQLDALPYTIVGVMPAEFDFPPSGNVDVWTPLSFDPNDAHGRSRKARSLNVIARLADGATPAQAQQEMSLVASRLASTFPDSNTGWGARIVAAQEQLVTTVRPALLLISGAVGFLLLIVCANVANLMLARLSSRRGELAVRAALGAGRVQLVRLDGGVLLFALLASALVSLVFGVVPAVQASRAGLRDTIDAFSGATRGTSARLLGVLVVVEVALALMLLVGAGLMTRSFAQLMRVSPGFEPANLLAVQIYLPQAKYKNGVARTRFYMEAIRRVGSLPGVRSAAGVSALPLYPVGIDFALPFTIEGKAPAANGEEPRADIRTATPGYFETMKIALLKGRLIDGHDLQGLPGAMVINETMARRYFGGEDPIGKVVKNPHGAATVVGIVGDVKHYGLDGEPRAELFMPAWQQPLNGMALVVRTASDPALFVDGIRRQILAIDAEQPIFDASPMADV